MAAAPAAKRHRATPQFGTIKGGPLDGWSFSFLRFVVIKTRLNMDLRCTRPGWPFPQEVRFNRKDQLSKLVAGPRAKRLDTDELIAAARELASTGKPS